MIRSIFIANRGEIAVRIIRCAKSLGIRAVLGASDADMDSVAAKLADAVVHLGPAEASRSYLDVEKVVAVAESAGCDAIHPGYGFLSERPELPEACKRAGLIFIGPGADAMRALGSKIAAKQLAENVGVPVVPGFFDASADDDALEEAALSIGFPLLLKASAGGGGRGMRAVTEPDQFRSELSLARTEAVNGFGDGTMMVEKLVQRPRHIEVQFVADAHGAVKCFYERECSIQRRRQKLIEEAPSPYTEMDRLWPELERAVGLLARGCGYQGAGTAEFLVDSVSGEFYFLEVNARLQVEHPVTEMITGEDLVELQIRVAEGQSLTEVSRTREQVNGWAMEARIIAEDPANRFAPSVGKILALAPPVGVGVRVDSGFQAGDVISPHYDSLIAKLITYGPTRESARKRMLAALDDFHILGVKTNIEYLHSLFASQEFASGELDTDFLERVMKDWRPDETLPDGLGLLVSTAEGGPRTDVGGLKDHNPWDATTGFRIGR